MSLVLMWAEIDCFGGNGFGVFIYAGVKLQPISLTVSLWCLSSAPHGEGLFHRSFNNSLSLPLFLVCWLLKIFRFLVGFFLVLVFHLWKLVVCDVKNQKCSLFFHCRSRRRPSGAAEWRLQSNIRHQSKWNEPQTPEVLQCKWNRGTGFPAQAGVRVLGPVFGILWATALCWSKKSAWIHTGTGNKNTTKPAV